MTDWFASVSKQAQDNRLRAQGSALQLAERFAAVANRLAISAQAVEATRASLDFKPLPPIDIEDALARLESSGSDALTMRERRALVAQPSRVPLVAIAQLLDSTPSLARHLVRSCLSDWRSFCSAPWGGDFSALLAHYGPNSGLGLFQGELGAPRDVLRRSAPSGTTIVAEALTGAPLERAYVYLHETLGLRDAWLYTAETLARWLQSRVSHSLSLEDAFRTIRATPTLQTMLLPSATSEAPTSGVRSDDGVHGEAVAALFEAAYRSSPLLSSSAFAELSGLLMRSSFGDPRLPPLSKGWTHVRRLAETSFRRFMTSLAEQDLEVFFTYAMHEQDRRAFWLSYLPAIERTGCLLDASLRQSLYQRLSGDDSLRGAVQRTHRFRRASSTQAFYLVFPQLVVVEFSEAGNAAYVYERDFFETNLESAIQRKAVESHRDLKKRGEEMYWLTHGGSWQSKAAQWLSTQGIHSKRRW